MATLYGIADWGPLVVSSDVDQAIIGVLREWLPTYVNYTNTERNLSYKLALPKSYSDYIDLDELIDNQIPAILVTTARALKTKGGANFTYQAEWEVTVSSVVRGPNPAQTKLLASLFEGAVRRCMLQKCRDNAGILSNCHWQESEVGPLRGISTREGRYLAAGIGKYNVATDAAAQGFGGPDVPDATSYAPAAVVTSVAVDVESED